MDESTNQLQSKLIEQVMHLQLQIEPIRQENFQLKDTILAINTYYEEQRNELSCIAKGCDQVTKQVADMPTLIKIIYKDYQLFQQEIEKYQQIIESQMLTIKELKSEKESFYFDYRQTFMEEQCKMKEKVREKEIEIEKWISNNDKLNIKIQELENIIEQSESQFENKVQQYKINIDQLKQEINQVKFKEEQTTQYNQQLLMKQTEDFKAQMELRKEQFEFQISKLKSTYDSRMDKIMKENDNRYQENQRINQRNNKEIDSLKARLHQEKILTDQQKEQLLKLQQQLESNIDLKQKYIQELQQKSLQLQQAQQILGNNKKRQESLQLELFMAENQKQDIKQVNQEQNLDQTQLFSNDKQQKQSINQNNQQQNQESCFNQYTSDNDISNQHQVNQQQSISNKQNESSIFIEQIEQSKKDDEKKYTIPKDQQYNTPEKTLNANPEVQQQQGRKLSISTQQTQKLSSILQYHQSSLKDYSEQDIQNQEESTRLFEQTPQSSILKRLKKKRFFRQRQRSDETRQLHFISKTSDKNEIIRRQQTNFYEPQTYREKEQLQINQISSGVQTDTYELDAKIMIPTQITNASPMGHNLLSSPYRKNSEFTQFNLLSTEIDEGQQIKYFKEQIKQLKEEIEIKNNSLKEISESAQQMELNFKENIKIMKMQLDKNQNENNSLLKQLEQEQQLNKKARELKQYLQQQVERNVQMQNQMNKASEIIKYFNKELENYKQTYNIFQVDTNRKKIPKKHGRIKQLPIIQINRNEQPMIKRRNKSYTIQDEAQILITQLYNTKKC